MRRNRSPSSSSPFRALAHHQLASANSNAADPVALIRSFNVETNPSRPMRPSPLTASTIRDMPLDLVDRIRSFPLFMSAPEEFLVAIGNHLKPQVQGANDHIITEGDDAKAMYWLVRGVVAVTSRDGEATFAELKPGAFFGEIGVLMDMPRTATIVARTKCLLLVLKKEDLQTIMPMFPQMEQAIREEAQERLTLLKKKRQENGGLIKSPPTESRPKPTAGAALRAESGTLKDGNVVNSKKRKSPSPGIIEDPAAGSAIGSGFVNIRRTLKELPLFSTLPPEILHFLGLSAQPKAYPPFSDIIRQGTSGSEIFFIVQGEAEVIHEPSSPLTNGTGALPTSRTRPRLKAGQYFGEVNSLGLSGKRTATVRSITTVECLMIPGDTLEELWKRCAPGIKDQVIETARMRYTKQDEDVKMSGSNDEDDSDGSPRSSHFKSSLPNLTFTSPSKPASPGHDENDKMEPSDPDPFLSVDMENMRNRRRHSLAPPTAASDASTATATATAAAAKQVTVDVSPLADISSLKYAFSNYANDSGTPLKRVRTLESELGAMSLPNLSDQLLVRVLQFLDVVDLYMLRQINSYWRRLVCNSPELCNIVDFSHHNRIVTDHVLANTLAPFIGQRAVSVDLSNCFHITDEGFSALWKKCGKGVKLWKMRSVWDVSANQILEMSENAKGLEEVDWSNCRKVGDNLLARVVGWVVPEQSPTTKKTAMVHTQKVRGGQRHEEEQKDPPPPGTVIGCPGLSRLNLSYCKHITDRSMAHLAAHASSRIQSLSLTRCTSITDAGFQTWAQHKFERLTHLCLADCTYLSDNAIVALVNSAKSLTHLDLSFCCALSDTATEVVALGLPKLRELRLAFCGSAVSDASLESVALHLNELEGISVRGCVRVTGKGLEYILRGCSHLDWVDVSQCRNLDPWFRIGSISKWGYDQRTVETNSTKRQWMTNLDEMSRSYAQPKTMSVAMLTTPSFYPRAGVPSMTRRPRHPVRFIVEKGTDGLR